MRSSLYIQQGEVGILIDTATEFRLQAVENNIVRVDAVFFTHDHADHISGFDDLRGYNKKQQTKIPCYGNRDTLATIRRNYDYAFKRTQSAGGKPQVSIRVINPQDQIQIGEVTVRPLPLWHGNLYIFGYLIQRKESSLAYITDCSAIPPATAKVIRSVDLLILGALRQKPHPTHLSIAQACRIAALSRAQEVYFTHICHDVEHISLSRKLPEGIFLSYDGLCLEM